MSTVCFLNGHLILREHKTGVHYYHEIVTRKLVQSNPKYFVKTAYFEKKNEYSKYIDQNLWIKNHIYVCRKWPRILSYFLPIEIFFGKNDIYICDGLVPYTFYKAKKICIVFDLMVLRYPENYSILMKIYLKCYFRRLKKADKIITISETTKQDIIEFYHIDPNKIDNCLSGVDLYTKETNICELENMEIDLDKKFLLYIGDMRPNKNLQNTIKGFLEFCESRKVTDLFLYLAGKKDGEYDKLLKIRKQSKYGKQIKFLGYISDQDKEILYQKAMAVLLISTYEGFGIPIIEGMQHFIPVITSNCNAMREVGEGAAILTDPFDTKAIADSIELVYSEKYAIDKTAYKKKLEQYTFDHVVELVNQSIMSCID